MCVLIVNSFQTKNPIFYKVKNVKIFKYNCFIPSSVLHIYFTKVYIYSLKRKQSELATKIFEA